MAEIQPDFSEMKKQPKRLPLWVFILAFFVLSAFIIVVFIALDHAQAGSIAVGKRIPIVQITTFDGQTMDTSKMDGKIILINFWASWCQPCAEEAIFLQQAYEQYSPGGEVIFMGIDYMDTEPDALNYIKEYQITFSNGPDLGSRIAQTFHIQGVPETYIVNRQGVLVFKQLGPFPSVKSITAVIDPLLK
jgi:cytochrome c biogenesis protein CcmG/thiol:disulfide interchange protein DsbE